jgi:hypothetical protein
MTGQWVEIEFDCLPLRSISRLDVPVDASPKYEQFILRVKAAMAKHGTLNTYYLHRGACVYHLTNDPKRGEVVFGFEGTVMTGAKDVRTRAVDVSVELIRESCEWLNEPMVEFLSESVRQALLVEFDRYIEAGDLEKTRQRIEKMQNEGDPDSFVGMYL